MTKTTKILKRVILTLIALMLAVVLYYVVAYAYLVTKAAFTWQCKIYVGEMSKEGREVCRHYNNGGLYEVLTN